MWSTTQELAFKKKKKLFPMPPSCNTMILKPVLLQVDASQTGLGGALLQPNINAAYQPAAFTYCTMSTMEQRYSQIEQECLATCHALSKFDHWLYGKTGIEIHTDH